MNYLSNIELYYSPSKNVFNDRIKITGDDFKHIIKVTRHSVGDEIYVTDGKGKIYLTEIKIIDKDFLQAEIIDNYSYKNKFENVIFCLPKLKNPERFEFALEKCTELGITNFIVFNSLRSVSKGNKIERWEKILISAMKQSLQSFLPSISLMKFEEIKNLDGNKIIFEQNSSNYFKDFQPELNKKYYFIFGPEGGLDNKEIEFLNDAEIYKLANNRLRSETAVVKGAAVLSELLN